MSEDENFIKRRGEKRLLDETIKAILQQQLGESEGLSTDSGQTTAGE